MPTDPACLPCSAKRERVFTELQAHLQAGRVDVSAKRIAMDTGIPLRTVFRCLQWLQEQGRVRWVARWEMTRRVRGDD